MVARGVPAEAAAAVVSAAAALNLTESSSNWWHDINESPLWQDRVFHILAVLYGIVAAIALVQLVRIQLRVPEYGWTTQKVFHFLNFLVNGVRCLVFIFRRNVQKLQPEIVQHILLDMPSLAFFTTYALLVLFWAEIYYQARAVSTDGLRPSFYTINAVVYVIQLALWLILWWKPVRVLLILSKVFFAGVSLFAALGFLLYGGRLFLMLQRFPVESKGRRKKLQEVGYVTTICFSCFLVRCVMMCFDAFDEDADLDVLDHPILNFIYYVVSIIAIFPVLFEILVSNTLHLVSRSNPLKKVFGVLVAGLSAIIPLTFFMFFLQLVEILPSSLVLFILRKLPPKRGITQYHPIR